jgi:hypothetical protein
MAGCLRESSSFCCSVDSTRKGQLDYWCGVSQSLEAPASFYGSVESHRVLPQAQLGELYQVSFREQIADFRL